MNKSLPWIKPNRELDEATHRVVRALIDSKKDDKKLGKLPSKELTRLTRAYKDAEQSRTPAGKFLRAFAEEMGLEDPDGSYFIADMKNLDRAAVKLTDAHRNISDLGRGRIYINSPKDYEAFYRVWRSKTKGGVVRLLGRNGETVADGSFRDYMKSPRKSGFAGFVNFDIEIDLGKGRTGRFEVQIMPRAYDRIDKVSHKLFDMIRILEETPPAYLTSADKQVRDALILANQALFVEHGIRTHFIQFREDKMPRITSSKLDQATSILDRIWSTLESLEGRCYSWMSDTKEAMTEAKTSLLNIYQAQKSGQALNFGHKP